MTSTSSAGLASTCLPLSKVQVSHRCLQVKVRLHWQADGSVGRKMGEREGGEQVGSSAG